MSAQSEEFLKNGEYKEPGLMFGVTCKGKMPMVLPNPSENCQTYTPMERKWVKLNQSGQTQIEVDRERKCLTMAEGGQIVSEWEIQKPKIQLEQEEQDSGGQCPEEWRDQIQFDELEISDDSLPVVTAIVRKSKSPKYIVDPVRLGWRAAQTITRVCFHFIDTARHKAHLRTKCKCRTCNGGCSEARKLLAKSCPVCKRFKKCE